MLRKIQEARRSRTATETLKSCKINNIFRWRTVVMQGTKANVSAFCLSATQDKRASFMKLLTLCYEDRTGVAHQSRCRRKGTELFERHSSREYSSQVLERDVTKTERAWSAVRLFCKSSLLSIMAPDTDWISGLRKEIELDIASNYYWPYWENFKIMNFMTYLLTYLLHGAESFLRS